MGRPARSLRRNTSAAGHSVEFFELLDPVTAAPEESEPVLAPITIAAPADEHADVDQQPAAAFDIVTTIEVAEPPQVSRFAEAGIDDDRLPLHTSAKRRRRG